MLIKHLETLRGQFAVLYAAYNEYMYIYIYSVYVNVYIYTYLHLISSDMNINNTYAHDAYKHQTNSLIMSYPCHLLTNHNARFSESSSSSSDSGCP